MFFTLNKKLDQILSSLSSAPGSGGGSDGSAGLPIGWMQAFHPSAIPDGWLPMDGRFVPTTAYPALYAMLGDAFSFRVEEAEARSSATSIVPVMTSNTAPSGVASASAVDSDYFAAWKAFDGSGVGWLMPYNVSSGWLEYVLPDGQTRHLVSYTIKPRVNDAEISAPRDWSIQGSNDGTTWDVLDTRAGESRWGSNQTNGISYELDTSQMMKSYSHFRLVITAKNEGSGYCGCAELTLMGLETLPTAQAPDGHFGLPLMTSSPTPIPGGVWCIKAV